MLLRALNDMWTALRSFDDQALTFAFWAVLVYISYKAAKNIIIKLRGKKCDRAWQMVLSICLFGVLSLYLSYLISLTLSGRDAGSRTNKVNLEIFGTFSPGGAISAHALENIFLFVPFGMLVPLTGRFFKRWWNLVLMTFLTSLLIETMQLATARVLTRRDRFFQSRYSRAAAASSRSELIRYSLREMAGNRSYCSAADIFP